MADLAQVDKVLLLVRGEVNESISFGHGGRPHRADRNHDWYHMALAQMGSRAVDGAMPDSRTRLVGVPTRRAMAVLAAATKPKARCAPSP